jgi:hypothetical protein
VQQAHWHVGFVSPNSRTITWSALADSLAGGQRPPLQVALLVDGEERLRSVDYRTAIPLAAMACEVAADRYADRRRSSAPTKSKRS